MNNKTLCATTKLVKLSNMDLENLEKKFHWLTDRSLKDCSVDLVVDATKVDINIGLLKYRKKIGILLENSRSYADKIIHSTTLLVSSRPAIFIARIILKFIKPNKPISIKYQRYQKL